MKPLQLLILLILLGFAVIQPIESQYSNIINPKLIKNSWDAKWITCPGISGTEYGVYLFRKTIKIDSVYKRFIVHVSADNRYKLYVNNQYVGNGPARGDLMKWFFETYDLAPYLKEGENVISAEVWNFADFRPMAQFSYQTGFIMQGDSTTQENSVNSNSSWMVIKDTAYSPIAIDINQYYVVGPGEKFIGEHHPWGWKNFELESEGWTNAKETQTGKMVRSYREYGNPSPITLYAREIPPMEMKNQRFASIRRSGNFKISDDFLKGKNSITIPAHFKIKILFDQSILTTAYPVLRYSMGKKAVIKMTYAESLFNSNFEKGNRNEIEKKMIIGNYDLIESNGSMDQVYQTLWWRTFRYVELEIGTQDESLTINDFYSIYTGYPFEEKALFRCNDSLFTKIWEVGWHTQRLCAGETYFDCPYYEQLQYVGDSRIQTLITSYVSGDTRLMKNAISEIHNSRLPFGLTQSRYPSYGMQIIPTFSLIWGTMVCDYYMICNDKDFVKSMIPAVLDVLNWFETKIDTTQLIGSLEWWNFVDWVNYKDWSEGAPPGIRDSHSSIINLQYVYTLEKVCNLLKSFGMEKEANYYNDLSARIKKAVFKTCYDPQKQLIADVPEKTTFSQHANLLAVLTNTFPKEMQKKVMNNIINDNKIAKCSFYFQFYLTEALEHVGMADNYTNMLDPWKKMIENGLTTFAETPDPTRSDCHAWSASPVYYMLSLICGIKPNEPGFNSVKIEPHLGNLSSIECKMPHRFGMIKVNLKKDEHNIISGEVDLPNNLTGRFIFNGINVPLQSGINKIQ